MKRDARQAFTLVAVLGVAMAVPACDRAPPTEPALVQMEMSVSAARSAVDYSYTVVGVPNTTWTQAYRMNARGDLVGSYFVGGVAHGFLLRQGSFQTIDVAGATATHARGINERGDIVGFYNAAGKLRGYLLSQGGFTTIEVPDAVGTRLWDISARGEISGDYQATTGGAWHALTWRKGEFTYVNVPNATMSAGFGINEQGDVVGHYTLPGSKMFGFKVSVDGFTHINHSASGDLMSCAQGIGVHGEVVGHYQDPASSVVYGYLWDNGEFTATLRVPEATQTYPMSITPAGVIAGYHWDAKANNWRGFVAKPLNPAGR